MEADLDLVTRLRAGDAGALEPLMARYASRVYRVAYGITRSEGDAEEVVQDVQDLRAMPTRFAALAQWYELCWGNRLSTRTELHALCEGTGLDVSEETAFSRFHIIVATKRPTRKSD